jgi:uncharacterized protein YggE
MTAPIVTVRGEAQIEVRPDLATLSVTVHSAGDSAERVRAELADASGRIGGLLEQYVAAIEQSSTSGLHIAPVFNRRTGTRITGYRGTFSTQIVVRDLDSLSPIVFALAPLPNSQIDGPWWSLRPDNAAYRDVRLSAIGEARRRADDYAGAVGATVLDLVEISDLETGFHGIREARMPMFAKGIADDAAFEFEPALQTVSGQVTVRFTITTPNLTKPPA